MKRMDYFIAYVSDIKYIRYNESDDEYEIVIVVPKDPNGDEEILVELHVATDDIRKLCEFFSKQKEKQK